MKPCSPNLENSGENGSPLGRKKGLENPIYQNSSHAQATENRSRWSPDDPPRGHHTFWRRRGALRAKLPRKAPGLKLPPAGTGREARGPGCRPHAHFGSRSGGGWEAPPGGLEATNPGVDRTGRRSRRCRLSLIIPVPPPCTETPGPAHSPLHAFWGSPASFLRLTRPPQLIAVMKLQRTNLSCFNAGETPRRACQETPTTLFAGRGPTHLPLLWSWLDSSQATPPLSWVIMGPEATWLSRISFCRWVETYPSPGTFVFKPLLLLVLEGQWQLPQILQNVGTQVCTRNSRVRSQKSRRSCPKQEQANWKKRVWGSSIGKIVRTDCGATDDNYDSISNTLKNILTMCNKPSGSIFIFVDSVKAYTHPFPLLRTCGILAKESHGLPSTCLVGSLNPAALAWDFGLLSHQPDVVRCVQKYSQVYMLREKEILVS